mgnify:CR=1 FL=1
MKFAGMNPFYPAPDTVMRVVQGENLGEKVLVVSIDGYVYDRVLKVVVRLKDGSLVWYWPWNLEVEESADPHPSIGETGVAEVVQTPTAEHSLSTPRQSSIVELALGGCDLDQRKPAPPEFNPYRDPNW